MRLQELRTTKRDQIFLLSLWPGTEREASVCLVRWHAATTMGEQKYSRTCENLRAAGLAEVDTALRPPLGL
jgi:hypothetical protein